MDRLRDGDAGTVLPACDHSNLARPVREGGGRRWSCVATRESVETLQRQLTVHGHDYQQQQHHYRSCNAGGHWRCDALSHHEHISRVNR